MEMPRETVLQVRQLHKLYARSDAPMRKRLAREMMRGFFGGRPTEIDTPERQEFWALRDISFDLRRGEALGVIGLNGSGKTTLLRILAGQILPDRGEVTVTGATAAMIDLQAGFQPAASGRRNIFLRAAALGFTRSEILAMQNEIIAFSELEEAIDAPMNTYSSGMKMRLAFSVMAMVQPDILFIDEVLAVGDFQFRQKCLARIREMRAHSAFVFVSHSMGDISRFCDRVIVLNKGRVIFEGPPGPAIEAYEALTSGADAPDHITRVMGPTFANPAAITDVEHYWCNGDGSPVTQIDFRDPIYLKVKFRSQLDLKGLNIGVPIWTVNAFYTTGFSTEITLDKFDTRAGEDVEFALAVPGGLLNPGTLKSTIGIINGVEFLYRQPNPDLQISKPNHPTWGAVTIPHTWTRRDDVASEMDEESTEDRFNF